MAVIINKNKKQYSPPRKERKKERNPIVECTTHRHMIGSRRAMSIARVPLDSCQELHRDLITAHHPYAFLPSKEH